MFTEAQRRNIVRRRIEVDKRLGTNVGGSGNLGSIGAHTDENDGE